MIRLVMPDGTRHTLRWTDQHPSSRYGLGVVLHARQSQPIDGAEIIRLVACGAYIECSDIRESRRIAGALAWSATALPDSAIRLREPQP